jgi:uncharacterized protein Yka (UPF0111/DUF47 family)
MRLSILPTDVTFYTSFTRQADLIAEAAASLEALCREWNPRSPIFDRVLRIEHQGDDLLHDVLKRLSRTFVPPLDREDIHRLTIALDLVLDAIQDAVVRMRLFGLGGLTDPCRLLARLLESASQLVQSAVSQLSSLKDATGLQRDMKAIEKRADEVYRRALGDLFCDGADPMHVIRWKEIYEHLENAVDRCQDVMDHLGSIVLKHS